MMSINIKSEVEHRQQISINLLCLGFVLVTRWSAFMYLCKQYIILEVNDVKPH